MSVPLSILDLVSISEGSTAREAIEASMESAKLADRLGWQIKKGRRVQVDKYLFRTLCQEHESEFNYRAAGSRQR